MVARLSVTGEIYSVVGWQPLRLQASQSRNVLNCRASKPSLENLLSSHRIAGSVQSGILYAAAAAQYCTASWQCTASEGRLGAALLAAGIQPQCSPITENHGYQR